MTRHGERILGMCTTMTPHKALIAFNNFINSLKILKARGVESAFFRGKTGIEWTFESFLFHRWINLTEATHANR